MSKVIINGKELDRKLVEELYTCISCRLGIIETGTLMRASDAINAGMQSKIKALTHEQRELINNLETLMYSLI